MYYQFYLNFQTENWLKKEAALDITLNQQLLAAGLIKLN